MKTKRKSNPEPLDFGGRYYVYALIDPASSTPFYIGKGGFDRAFQHFRALGDERGDGGGAADSIDVDPVAGAAPAQIWQAEGLDDLDRVARGRTQDSAKIRKIRELLDNGVTSESIPRVLARNLSSEAAHAIEALLIKGVYGRAALTNAVAGHHEERFRAVGDWSYRPGWDLPANAAGELLPDDGRHPCGAYYTYVLRDPTTGAIFYVGKGTGGRLCDHFRNARTPQRTRTQGAKATEEKRMLERLRSILEVGHSPNQVGRIIARVDSEALAFAIESFYMKFVTGFEHVRNVQSGHSSGWFRARGDWKMRHGFDLPISIRGGWSRMKLDGYLGEGLDVELLNVASSRSLTPLVSDLAGPRLVGAGELGYYYKIRGVSDHVRLRIQIRSARRFQILLEFNGKAGAQWKLHNFSRFGLYALRRRDNLFFPDCWLGARAVTDSPQEAVRRACRMARLARTLQDATDAAELQPFQDLLEGLPYPAT